MGQPVLSLIQIFQKILLTFNGQCPSHIETSQLICRTNQLSGFYVRGTLTVKGLITYTESLKEQYGSDCIIF